MWELGNCLFGSLLNALVSFVHVLDVSLKQQEIGSVFAVDLQGAAVVPLNRSLNLFAVLQHDYHQGVRIDLLLVIEELGVGFHRRRRPLSRLRCVLLRPSSLSYGFSAALSIPASDTMRTVIGTLARYGHLTYFALNLGKRRSDQFTITHLSYLQSIKTG